MPSQCFRRFRVLDIRRFEIRHPIHIYRNHNNTFAWNYLYYLTLFLFYDIKMSNKAKKCALYLKKIGKNIFWHLYILSFVFKQYKSVR